MGSLLHPVGAQPGWVYWARRAGLIVALVAVIAIGFFLFRPPDANIAAVPAGPSTMATPAASTPAASDTPSATASPTPTGPLACDQTNSGLSLAGYQKVKQDAKQSFKVGVKNTGSQPCVLDLSAANFSLSVTSGTDRIWSTADCAKWVPAKKQTLKSQQSYEFSIEWGVLRSAAGCKEAKGLLNPGTYVAQAVFADTVKSRQVFLVTKKG
ncbi:MAG TPA: hypothetical protein VFW55_03510 [Propionicimonas sp.]|nr:hypothetical protein [Propionicimonas sp.]